MSGRNFTLDEDGGVIIDGRKIYNYCVAFNSDQEEPSIRRGKHSCENCSTRDGKKVGPRLRECCRQGQAEVVINSSNEVHLTL